MKRILLIGALCGGCARASHAQKLATWLEQLAALRALEQTVQQGYQTAATGLRTIGDITTDEYGLHSTYYGSLDTVNAAIGDDPKVTTLRNRLNTLIQRLRTELDYWQKQTPILQQ